jgi:hypothetical protein
VEQVLVGGGGEADVEQIGNPAAAAAERRRGSVEGRRQQRLQAERVAKQKNGTGGDVLNNRSKCQETLGRPCWLRFEDEFSADGIEDRTATIF